MTVAELIERLGYYDPKARVVVSGLDGYGYSNVTGVSSVRVVPTDCSALSDYVKFSPDNHEHKRATGAVHIE